MFTVLGSRDGRDFMDVTLLRQKNGLMEIFSDFYFQDARVYFRNLYHCDSVIFRGTRALVQIEQFEQAEVSDSLVLTLMMLSSIHGYFKPLVNFMGGSVWLNYDDL